MRPHMRPGERSRRGRRGDVRPRGNGPGLPGGLPRQGGEPVVLRNRRLHLRAWYGLLKNALPKWARNVSARGSTNGRRAGYVPARRGVVGRCVIPNRPLPRPLPRHHRPMNQSFSPVKKEFVQYLINHNRPFP